MIYLVEGIPAMDDIEILEKDYLDPIIEQLVPYFKPGSGSITCEGILLATFVEKLLKRIIGNSEVKDDIVKRLILWEMIIYFAEEQGLILETLFK
jgi:hypothetical protein